MKKLVIIFFSLLLLQLNANQLININAVPHVSVNLQKGYVTFYLGENKIIHHSLSDPAYLKAVSEGKLDIFFNTKELSLTSRGYFPLPVKIADFENIDLDYIPGAEKIMAFYVWAKYLGEPASSQVYALTDVSLFAESLMRGDIEINGTESSLEIAKTANGTLTWILKKKKEIPEIPDAKVYKWFDDFLGITCSAPFHFDAYANLEEVDALLDVLPDGKRPRVIREDDVQVACRLLLAGYPLILYQKNQAYSFYGVNIEDVYTSFQGRTQISTLKKLNGKSADNALSVLKIKRLRNEIDSKLMNFTGLTELKEKLNQNSGQQQDERKLDFKQTPEPLLLPFTRVCEELETFKNIPVAFSILIEDMRLNKEEGLIYLKTGNHFFKVKYNKMLYASVPPSLTSAKALYAKKGGSVGTYMSPIFFSGTLKSIEANGEIIFEDTKCLSYSE
jgi:hypothetical protein